MNSSIEFLNSDELLKNPAFSQVAITKDLQIIGKGDIATQTEYVLKNIETALTACGATLDDLFKLTIYIVQRQDAQKGFKGAQGFLKN